MDLSTKIAGIKLNNPTILASGILGVSKAYFKALEDSGVGGITIKSISKEERSGHKSPVILPFEAGMMNAVGYSNPGINEAKKEFTDLSNINVPIIASIIGSNTEDFRYMAKNFLHQGFSAVEIPLSCPHTPGFGTLAGQSTPEMTFKITKAVKEESNIPVIVKLSPNVPNIVELAKAAEKAGADMISACNTLGPGMSINIETRSPVLGFKVGGISGPALKPIAVRCVYEIYENVNIPIIGIGGITSGRDALEMIMAGASAVGIGSGIYYRGINIFSKICKEMQDWMSENKIDSVKEIIGAAHE